MTAKPLRILLADDHDVVRSGVRTLIEAHGWQVCGEATNGYEALKLVAVVQTDVAVLDLEMGDIDARALVQCMREQHPQVEVVVFTVNDDEYLIRQVLSAGARAFILKSEGGRKLIQAIEMASQHMPFFAARASETLLSNLLKSQTANNDSGLTYREREIVQLLASGSSNKEVATALGISVKTVETHRAKIMRKLGVSSIVKLVRFAVREHLIKA
jgi:DNA-binding NarL/FixJ family response regulator